MTSPYIIAEIGFNHEGDIAVAARMIRAAGEAGAHAVKFQTFKAIDIALSNSPHYDALKNGEMTLNQHKTLSRVAKECKVDFLSTPFSIWAVELLEKLDISAYKVASMDCTNKHLLKSIANTRKPVYLSTGMASLAEINDTLQFFKKNQSGPVTLLHCMSLYPAKAKDLNLTIIPFLKQVFDIPVGYSDHFPGTKACLAAAMLSADIIETHFTLDSSQKGGDHFHSVEPFALKQLISDIALFKNMQGNHDAIFSRPDREYVQNYRRGLYAATAMEKGTPLNKENLLTCRPASDLSPNDIFWLKGKKINKEVRPYQAISGKDINREMQS